MVIELSADSTAGGQPTPGDAALPQAGATVSKLGAVGAETVKVTYHKYKTVPRPRGMVWCVAVITL